MAKLVDAIGDVCPTPVIKTKKAIAELGGAGEITVWVDNDTAVQNVMKLAQSVGAQADYTQESEKKYVITIEVPEAETAKAGSEAEEPAVEAVEAGCKKNVVVVISSNQMGSGNEALGKVLIKGFIYALTQLDELPKKILFYNGGAQLTCEGSDSLEDLKNLEAQGVEIMTCGTCLDYYKLKEKLAVGSVTNMYSITESMQQADLIMKP